MDGAEGPERKPPLAQVAAVTAGNALEFYDFVSYAFFAIYIGRAFFPAHDAAASLLASLATFGAGFLTRPIGGLVLGPLADRIGRKPVLVFSFSLMGLGMAGLALTPDYARIGIAAPILAIGFRLAQGFALGGEVGPATAFLLEAAPERRRALYTTLQAVSQGLAGIAASAAGLVLTLVLDPAAVQAWGWRAAFLIGLAIVPFGLWLRRRLPETLTPGRLRPAGPGRRAAADARVLVCAFVLLTGGTMQTYAGAYVTTWAMDSLHLSPAVAFGRTVVVTSVQIAFLLVGAACSDRIGRRPVMIWPTLAVFLLAPAVYLTITAHPSLLTLYLGGSLLVAIGAFGGGAMYAAMTESLPAEIRAGAFGIIYAFAISVFGGSTQLVIKWLIVRTHDPMTLGWFVTGATGLVLLGVLGLRESAPARLPLSAALAAAE